MSTLSSMTPRTSRFNRPNKSAVPTFSRTVRSSDMPKFDIPAVTDKMQFIRYKQRHNDDAQFEKHFDYFEATQSRKIANKAETDCFDRYPSYTNFKVPFQMTCQERYRTVSKKYEQQFHQEIKNLIDNQPTAREATYFVRIVSYTSLWPPYHSETEQTETSRKFYSLTPKESARYQYIMSHDF